MRHLLAVCVVCACSGVARGGTILINVGFETGQLTPWFHGIDGMNGPTLLWVVTDTDSHDGAYSAMNVGNNEIRQTFSPVPTSLIDEVSYWIKRPDPGAPPFSATRFWYSDSTSNSHFSGPVVYDGWIFIDATPGLIQGKNLVGVGIFGYSASGGDRTFLDSLRVDVIPEPSSWILALTAAVCLWRRLLRTRQPCSSA